MSRATSLFLFITGGALVPIGFVLYLVPSGLSLVGLYLFLLGGALWGIALLANLKTLVAARWVVLAELAEAVLYVSLVGLCLLSVNRTVAQHPWRRDCTADRISTLTGQTRQVLGRLAAPVNAVVFVRRRDSRVERVTALLGEYAQASSLFRFQIVDPQERPSEANRLGVAGQSVMVLESGTRAVRVKTFEEPFVTAALLRLTTPPVTVGFVIGHGERDLKGAGRDQLSGLLDVLELENVEPVRFSLSSAPEVPDALRALVISGPRGDLSPEEIQRIERFLKRGRGVLLTLELAAGPQPMLASFLGRLGVEAPSGIVVDMDLHAKNDAGTLVIPQLPTHAITRGVAGVVLSGARPLAPRRQVGPDTLLEPLVVTGQRSWAEMDAPREFAFTPGRDLEGPVTVALALSGPSGRLCLVGNTLFMTDLFLGAMGNRDLLTNSIGWVSQTAEMPGIVPDPRMHRMLALPAEALQVIGAVVCLGMPMVTALLALFCYLYRR
ncbi:MAG: GldG family protein [Candidatus Riflebacteria bacterium]|nr:GldG family protein [Candidatus Riflebacteria bacterium]